MIGFELFMACAPNVAPQTIQKIIRVESKGNPLAINVNAKWVNELDKYGKPKRRKVTFQYPIEVKTVQDAVTVAYAAIADGHTVDMGYMQVNSSNLKALGYSVEEMFDPCKNIAAGARVITEFYSQTKPKYSDEQSALLAALSAYNTGSYSRGFENGYVSRYFNDPPIHISAPAISSASNPYTADTAVVSIHNHKKEKTMNTKERTIPVVSTTSKDAGTPGVQVEYSAEEAEAFGAFEETALSEADAWESNADAGIDNSHTTGIVIAGKAIGPEDH
jgi:type IV secretion system protein VirB1